MEKTEKNDSLLRKYRKKEFETLEAFCKEFKKQTGERLTLGTMSAYERGFRISSRRFDLLSEVLKLSDYKKRKVKKTMWEEELKYRQPHKEYEMRKVRKKRKTKEGATTVAIRPIEKKRAANSAPGIRKEKKNKHLIKQVKTDIATRQKQIAKSNEEIKKLQTSIASHNKQIAILSNEIKTYEEVIKILS